MPSALHGGCGDGGGGPWRWCVGVEMPSALHGDCGGGGGALE
jgi:hypothetical protein